MCDGIAYCLKNKKSILWGLNSSIKGVEALLRAENETRTRDPNLGKVVLYQLSYFRKGFSEKHVLLAEMRVQRYAIFLNGQKKCVTFLRGCRKILTEQGCMRLLWGANTESIDILCVL